MAAATQLGLLISANTSGGGAIDSLANQVGKLVDNIDKAHESAKKPGFDKFADTVKNAIQNPLQAASSAADGFIKSIGPAGVAVAGTAAAMGVLAKVSFDAMEHLGKLGTEIHNVSVRTGLTTKEVGQFSFAAKAAGSDISAFETAMRMLSKGLADNSEDGKKARNALKDLGIVARDSHGELLPMSEIFLEISRGLNGIEDPANRNAKALAIFGRAGIELLPVITGLSDNIKRAKELGLGIDEKTVKQWEGYHRQMVEIETLWAKLKREFEKPLAARMSIVLKWVTAPPTQGQQAQSDAIRAKSGYWAAAGQHQAAIDYGAVPGGENYIDLRGGIKYPGVDFADNTMQQTAADIASRQRGTALLSGIQSRYGGTRAGLEGLLKSTREEADKLRSELFSMEGSGEEAILAAEKKWRAAEKAAAGYEARLKAIKEREDLLKDTEKLLSGPYANMMRYGTTENWGIRKNQTLPSDLVTNSVMNEYGYWMTGAGMKFGSGFDQRPGNDWWATQERLEKASLDHRIRMVELLSGPGGEVQAVERVYQLRMAAAKTEEEAQAARYEMEERIAQIQRQRVEQWASTVQGAFMAGIQGGRSGLGSFARSQATGMLGTVAGNVGRMTFDAAQKFLPNAAEGSFLGKLLVGTPFGPDANAIATDENTKATQENTTAIRALATSATGGGGGLVRGAMYGGGYQGRGIFSFLNGSDREDPYASENGELASLIATDREGWKKNLAGYGSLAAGGFGAYMGIRQGGVKGGLTAAGSLAGGMSGAIASGLFGASAASGPLAPILAGAALGIGMITSFFGDPKAKRGKEIEDWTAGHQNSEPVPVNIVRDTYGRERWEDYRGGMHSGTTVIYAMDAQSFTEFAERNPEGFNRGVKAMVNSGGEGVPALQSAMGLA